MAEQTFRFPGFFEREIDLTARQVSPTGTPAGVIGTSERGPAFVPVTVGSMADFRSKFGDMDTKKFGPYAVNEFLKHRQALTYLRVLGAGANSTLTDISATANKGMVKNAGFVVTGKVGAAGADQRHVGAVQLLVAKHRLTDGEVLGFPMFSDNDSYVADAFGETVNLVRAVLFTANTARLRIVSAAAVLSGANVTSGDDVAGLSAGEFQIIVSSSQGSYFASDSNLPGVKAYTVSLNPSSASYISNVLNTDPDKFLEKQHLLYLDFAVDGEVAQVDNNVSFALAMTSGSAMSSSVSGDTNMTTRDAFGHFDSRYNAPKTTRFISQPFGDTEYDLFHFESLDDGAYANTKIKVSIANLQMSNDPANEYGTFAVQIRAFDDVDADPKILEQFPGCTLNPSADNYVAKVMGDKKVHFNFDADQENERRLVLSGKYPNRSRHVCVVMNDSVEKRLVPATALPFGFRGVPTLKTNSNLTDLISGTDINRLTFVCAPAFNVTGSVSGLSGSIVPPVPFRFKTTRGAVNTSSPGFAGDPGVREVADSRLYWGVKFERNSVPTDANSTEVQNKCITAFTKFAGIQKLDVLVTGSGADTFNENKFTLARVAFAASAINAAFTSGTIDAVMREAAYVRNGDPVSPNYVVNDGTLSRITFGTLIAQTSSVDFNRFTPYAKFTNFFYGGFDGTNILDRNASRLNDKSSAMNGVEAGAVAATTGAFATNVTGLGKDNNTIATYVAAGKIMTDPLAVNVNILATPGMREPYVTDSLAKMTKEYGQALYLLDIEERDENNDRIFDDSTTKPDVRKTRESFEGRAIDNNYAASYFPNVVINDTDNNRLIEVPASVAAIAALAFNDKVSYPWFAPAGFNRAALDFVKNVDVRLNTEDKNSLYDARINPIVSFPTSEGGQNIVIFGQKTLQQARSALDRVNVRRLMLDIKRLVSNVAMKTVFEQNTKTTRDRFVSQVVPLLAIVQSQAGIEKFRVIMDESNNSQTDIEANRLNGRIIVVPTRAVEYIQVDFIVTNSGVSFS